MALSSICFEGWISLGGLFGTVKLTDIVSTPHFRDVEKPGHYDNGIDEECASYLTPEQREKLSALPQEQRELGRDLIVREAHHPGLLRRFAREIPDALGRWF